MKHDLKTHFINECRQVACEIMKTLNFQVEGGLEASVNVNG